MLVLLALAVLFHHVYFVQGADFGGSVYFLVTNQSFFSTLYRDSTPVLSFQGLGLLYESNGSLVVVDDNGTSLTVFLSTDGRAFSGKTIVERGLVEGTPLFSEGFLAVINDGALQVYDVYTGKLVENATPLGEPLAFYYPYLVYGYITGTGIQAYEYDIATNATTSLGTVDGVGFTPNGTLVEIVGGKIVLGNEDFPLPPGLYGGDNYVQEGYYNNSLYLLIGGPHGNETEVELLRIGSAQSSVYSETLQGTYVPTSLVFIGGQPYGVFVDPSDGDAYSVPFSVQPLEGGTSPPPSPSFLYFGPVIVVLAAVLTAIYVWKRLRS